MDKGNTVWEQISYRHVYSFKVYWCREGNESFWRNEEFACLWPVNESPVGHAEIGLFPKMIAFSQYMLPSCWTIAFNPFRVYWCSMRLFITRDYKYRFQVFVDFFFLHYCKLWSSGEPNHFNICRDGCT